MWLGVRELWKVGAGAGDFGEVGGWVEGDVCASGACAGCGWRGWDWCVGERRGWAWELGGCGGWSGVLVMGETWGWCVGIARRCGECEGFLGEVVNRSAGCVVIVRKILGRGLQLRGCDASYSCARCRRVFAGASCSVCFTLFMTTCFRSWGRPGFFPDVSTWVLEFLPCERTVSVRLWF